jgi:DNA mismatch repair protein MutS2
MKLSQGKQRFPAELYLRHATIADAMNALDGYLDAAFMAGLRQVCIVHGQGGGILRGAVRASLKQHPLVNSFRSGRPNEGADGVTVVRLAERPEKPCEL